MNKNILYCICSGGFYGVIEDEIIERDIMFIHTKRTFSLQVAPQQSMIKKVGQNQIEFIIAIYDNVMMRCDFISDMAESSQFYQNIMEILSGEARLS